MRSLKLKIPSNHAEISSPFWKRFRKMSLAICLPIVTSIRQSGKTVFGLVTLVQSMNRKWLRKQTVTRRNLLRDDIHRQNMGMKKRVSFSVLNDKGVLTELSVLSMNEPSLQTSRMETVDEIQRSGNENKVNTCVACNYPKLS